MILSSGGEIIFFQFSWTVIQYIGRTQPISQREYWIRSLKRASIFYELEIRKHLPKGILDKIKNNCFKILRTRKKET